MFFMIQIDFPSDTFKFLLKTVLTNTLTHYNSFMNSYTCSTFRYEFLDFQNRITFDQLHNQQNFFPKELFSCNYLIFMI